MAEPAPTGKIPITLQLPAELAARLKTAAENQRRPAAELAVELLERYLPKPPGAGTKKSSIPYL